MVEQEMKAIVVALFTGLVGCAFVQRLSAEESAKYSETVLHSFGNGDDGQQPFAGVIDVKGALYGTTLGGGNQDCPNGCGTIFSVDPTTGAEKVLHEFNGDPDLNPVDNMIAVKGVLYGTTAGGDTSNGSVFAFDLKTGVETDIYDFCRQPKCADGLTPEGSLIDIKGTLFGTTFVGGNSDCSPPSGCGTVFSLDPKTHMEKVLYAFCIQPDCADGSIPYAGVTDVNGMLYGTTYAGGNINCDTPHGCGTVFSLDPKTGVQKVLYSFGGGLDGANPQAVLIDANGVLYGTTTLGGTGDCFGTDHGCGTVFSIDLKTGAEKVIYTFCSRSHCADGGEPGSVIDENGMLYGTTYVGGKSRECDKAGCGIVFSLDPNTGTEKVLHSFCSQQKCVDGATPPRGLIDVKGTFYGTTQGGGAHNHGTIFMLQKTQ